MTTQPMVPPPGRGRPIPRSLLAVLSLTLVVALLWASGSVWPFVYSEARAFARWRLQRQLADWPGMESEHFVLKYQPEDENVAAMVLDTAEKAYAVVTKEANFIPLCKTLVALYPSAEELNAVFGWSPQESALGVYWGGTIRVLSPNDWVGEVDEDLLKEIFWVAGPMVHEFTHLILDYKTDGNYPRWFSEGLAQYMELKYCGAVLSASSDLCIARLYSIQDLDSFTNLDDEQLAYQQSLSLVEFMVETGGPEVLGKIVNSLAKGSSFGQALSAAGMPPLATIEEQWLDWIK
ncbi:MAG TPA: hypothetical protein GXX69_06635 [Firmicutes bacterium]|nr:hypothetical protein [Bacillota bacterium]